MRQAKEPQPSIQQSIDACVRDSHAGGNFGDIVARLAKAGVESYHADYRRDEITYYFPSGESYCVELHAPDAAVGADFEVEAVRASIRGAQRGEVKYPEFLQRTLEAGCVGYVVWIAGRHVRYFGRKGEEHVEHFPS